MYFKIEILKKLTKIIIKNIFFSKIYFMEGLRLKSENLYECNNIPKLFKIKRKLNFNSWDWWLRSLTASPMQIKIPDHLQSSTYDVNPCWALPLVTFFIPMSVDMRNNKTKCILHVYISVNGTPNSMLTGS